jgi:hypothetical protein
VTVAAFDVPHALPPLPSGVASLAGPVTVLSDAAHPSSIVLPIVRAASASAPTPTPSAGSPGTGAGSGTSGRLPATGAAVPLAVAALALMTGLLLRRARA